jgi:hypothetical protein
LASGIAWKKRANVDFFADLRFFAQDLRISLEVLRNPGDSR